MLNFLYTPAGVITAEITFFTPFVVRPLLAAFALMPRAQLDVAASLGASPLSGAALGGHARGVAGADGRRQPRIAVDAQRVRHRAVHRRQGRDHAAGADLHPRHRHVRPARCRRDRHRADRCCRWRCTALLPVDLRPVHARTREGRAPMLLWSTRSRARGSRRSSHSWCSWCSSRRWRRWCSPAWPDRGPGRCRQIWASPASGSALSGENLASLSVSLQTAFIAGGMALVLGHLGRAGGPRGAAMAEPGHRCGVPPADRRALGRHRPRPADRIQLPAAAAGRHHAGSSSWRTPCWCWRSRSARCRRRWTGSTPPTGRPPNRWAQDRFGC